MTPFSTAKPAEVQDDSSPSWLDAKVARVLTTAPPGHAIWHDAHVQRIGGRAAVSILLGGTGAHGVDGSPLTEYQRLTGKIQPLDPWEDESVRPLLRWGLQSEGLHREMLAGETGYQVDPPIGTIQSVELPYLIGSPDGTVVPPDGKRKTLELKAPHPSTWSRWEAEVPTAARLQGAYYAILMGLDEVLVSALTPPVVRYGRLVVDDKLRELIIGRLHAFWEKHVLADIPPQANAGKVDLEILKRLHPLDDGSIVQVKDVAEARRDYERWEQIDEEVKALEAERDAIKSRWAQRVGNATWAEGPGFAVAWKHEAREGHTVSPSVTRKFYRARQAQIGGGRG